MANIIVILKKKSTQVIVMLFVLFAMGGYIYGKYETTKALKKLHCSDFQTQDEAQDAYEHGAKYLDGHDKDGKACEHLPKNKKIAWKF